MPLEFLNCWWEYNQVNRKIADYLPNSNSKFAILQIQHTYGLEQSAITSFARCFAKAIGTVKGNFDIQ